METLGQVLKRYREAAKFSIEDFSNLTKIPSKVISALEADNFAMLSEDFYIKGYIKNYARYLNLSHQKLTELFEKQAQTQEVKRGLLQPNVKKTKIMVTPKIIQVAVIAIVAVVLIGYLFFQVQGIFQPPKLEISNPSENVAITERFIHIEGLTEKESLVQINDKEIFIEADGSFSTILDLHEGLNLIKITSKKKHSKESVIFREILVE